MKVDTDVLQGMYSRCGLEKKKLHSVLREIGPKFLTSKLMKRKWTKENPTENYCYLLSEFIYKFVLLKNTCIPYTIKLDLEVSHWFLRCGDGFIIDLSADQFLDYERVNYGESFKQGFPYVKASKNVLYIAEKMGYTELIYKDNLKPEERCKTCNQIIR